MALSPFELERRRLEAGRGLPSACFDEFQRLSRTLLYGPPFQWLLVDAPQDVLRKQVMAALDAAMRAAALRTARLPISEGIADAAMLEQRLIRIANQHEVVHLIGRPGWFTPERWQDLNIRRERIADSARVRWVLWLDEQAIESAAQSAPDLWAWRGGVYSFRLMPDASTIALRVSTPLAALPATDPPSHAEKHRRVAELRDWLNAHPLAADEHRLVLIDELGTLQFSTGALSEAAKSFEEGVKISKRMSNERAQAIMLGKIADVLQAQGEFEDALRIRREEQLPVFERLSDLWSRAVTLGKVADVHQLRGELDRALRIRREEQLPVFARLGDQRSTAVTMGQIADVLQSRGELDEALRIRREEELPVFERLGDQRERAVTLGKIADLLQNRGELDEALRIRREEELPIFERLGDQRERAITLGRIADALQDRGDIEEALRIRRDEQLPVFERLGDQRETLVARAKLAIGLLARKRPGDQQEARVLLALARTAAERMKLPEAEQIRAIERSISFDEPTPTEDSGGS